MAIGRVFAYLPYAKPWVTVQHGAGAYLTGCEREQRKDKQMDTQTKGWGLVVCAEETPAPTLSHVEQWGRLLHPDRHRGGVYGDQLNEEDRLN